jgi:hypothetical protein
MPEEDRETAAAAANTLSIYSPPLAWEWRSACTHTVTRELKKSFTITSIYLYVRGMYEI